MTLSEIYLMALLLIFAVPRRDRHTPQVRH